jgi:hypothetical protein
VTEERTSSGKPMERSTFTPAGGAKLGTPRPKGSPPVHDPEVKPAGGKEPPIAPPPLDPGALKPEAPKVAMTSVEHIEARVGDTWETLSTRAFGDDRFADALKAFNRDYQRSSRRMRDEGTFAAGETIYIPPTQTLLDRYRMAIRPPSGLRPPPPTASTTRGF